MGGGPLGPILTGFLLKGGRKAGATKELKGFERGILVLRSEEFLARGRGDGPGGLEAPSGAAPVA